MDNTKASCTWTSGCQSSAFGEGNEETLIGESRNRFGGSEKTWEIKGRERKWRDRVEWIWSELGRCFAGFLGMLFFSFLICSFFSSRFFNVFFSFFVLLLICRDVSCIFFLFSLFHHLQCLLIYYEHPDGVRRVAMLNFIII